ncbi:hypothetical protein P5673_004718, partial [Acropora cervicornis]
PSAMERGKKDSFLKASGMWTYSMNKKCYLMSSVSFMDHTWAMLQVPSCCSLPNSVPIRIPKFTGTVFV